MNKSQDDEGSEADKEELDKTLEERAEQVGAELLDPNRSHSAGLVKGSHRLVQQALMDGSNNTQREGSPAASYAGSLSNQEGMVEMTPQQYKSSASHARKKSKKGGMPWLRRTSAKGGSSGGGESHRRNTNPDTRRNNRLNSSASLRSRADSRGGPAYDHIQNQLDEEPGRGMSGNPFDEETRMSPRFDASRQDPEWRSTVDRNAEQIQTLAHSLKELHAKLDKLIQPPPPTFDNFQNTDRGPKKATHRDGQGGFVESLHTSRRPSIYVVHTTSNFNIAPEPEDSLPTMDPAPSLLPTVVHVPCPSPKMSITRVDPIPSHF